MAQSFRRRPRPPRQPAVRRMWDESMREVAMRREWQLAQGRRQAGRRASTIASIGAYAWLTLIAFLLTLGWLNRDALSGFSNAYSATDTSEDPDIAAMISFGLCHSGSGRNCVVDGDTFWLNGEKIRIADIDTPETHPPRCTREGALGERATVRLQQLLNAGPIILAANPGGDNYDRYGRRLAVIERGGASIGMMLVSEGLARPYAGGQRAEWC